MVIADMLKIDADRFVFEVDVIELVNEGFFLDGFFVLNNGRLAQRVQICINNP